MVRVECDLVGCRRILVSVVADDGGDDQVELENTK